MDNIPLELKTLTEVLRESKNKSPAFQWARISIVVTSDGFYPLINGKVINPKNNDYPTIEETMAVIHREVDRLCTEEDLLAKTLGIEVAA